MELVPGESYAVLLHGIVRTPLRPLWGEWDGRMMTVHDPDNPIDEPILRQGAVGLEILGRWGEAARHPAVPQAAEAAPGGRIRDLTPTWRDFAAGQHHEVLRQRALVGRLAALGIHRDPEPYIIRPEASSTVLRSLQLNYDELEALLDAAGAPH